MSWSIQRRIVFFFSVTFIFLIAILLIIGYGGYLQKELAQAQKKRFESYRLATHLKMTSDQLTRMARTYAVTGDPRYEKYYHIILKIRNGQEPRPKGYDEIFWDLVTLKHDYRPNPTGEKISLIELMRRAGIRDKELAKLQEAKEASDRLAHLEKEAFRLIAMARSDAQMAPSNRLAAQEILFGSQYHEAKASIMRSIRDFYRMIDRRTRERVEHVQSVEILLDTMLTVLVFFLLIFAFFSFYHSRRFIVRPLHKLIEWTHRIKEEQYRIDEEIPNRDEIGQLARSFLAMADTIYANINRLDKKANSDGLTGLANRRRLSEELDRCHHAVKYYKAACGVVLCDIDHFKKINDSYGHNVGDEVIREIARILKLHTPQDSLAGRWGGEEFLILLKHKSQDEAAQVAERIRRSIQESPMHEGLRVTASFGVASMRADEDWHRCIHRADEALYRSKRNGRNRVEISPDEEER